MQRNSKPLAWRPKGLSDSLDASESFPGAMSVLMNLIPDPTTDNLWQCRPAAVQLVSLLTTSGPFSSEFSTEFQQGILGNLGQISVFKIIGTFMYGMVNSLSLVPGFDIPYCINLLNNTVVPVTGTQNTTTLPASQPATGAWTPPRMAQIGVKMMVAHIGFTGVGNNYIGWFDLTTPSAPVWNAGNMTGLVTFTTAPTDVAQFYNRAYYIHNAVGAPAVIYSDTLNPTNATNANQVLTFGDQAPLTALGGLPLNNELGGIIQSLMVFKDQSNIWQITGDAALMTLSQNTLNVATGTASPNSIVTTPKGLGFIAPDGFRLIDFNANVSDPIGFNGQGVSVPFIYSAVPSRIMAACNSSYLRITTQNGYVSGNPTQEYWFDFSRKKWHGPHSSTAQFIQPYETTFLMAPTFANASIWQSDPVQSNTSVFVENGTQLTWKFNTCLLPDTDAITNNCITESSIDLALPPTSTGAACAFLDQNGSSISSVVVSPPQSSAASTIWGQFIWGQANWAGGTSAFLAPYQLAWTLPIVFARGSFQAQGNSLGGIKIGALHFRYQILRTLVSTAAAA